MMQLFTRDFTLFLLVLLMICIEAVGVQTPSFGQNAVLSIDLVPTATTSSASSLSLEALRQLRDRDSEGALETLGTLVDRPVTIGDLCYSELPSAAAGLHRSLAQLSSDQQYALLERWTLPDGQRNNVRMLSVPVPTDAPPKVFARSLGERPRDSTFDVASVGPVRGIFCSGWTLARAADDLGRLARLRLALEKLADDNVAGATELLMLAHLAGNRGDLERVTMYLQTRSAAGVENPSELTAQDIAGAAIASAALLHQETQPLSESFLQTLVDRGALGKGIGLRPFLRIASATATQVHRGESPPGALFQNPLKYWLPATVRSAREIERGQPNGVWLTHEQHVLHLAGGTADVLFCRFPIVGDFDFVCETQEGGSIGTDGGLAYGGLHFQALGRKNLLTVWDADNHHALTKPSPFARYDIGPVFNRVSIRSTKDASQFESNFHPVWFDGAAAESSPWLGLRSSGTKRPVFRNLRLTGNPVIPQEVTLTSGNQLRGWQSNFFGESQPKFKDPRAAGEEPDQHETQETFDWQIQSGELIAAKQKETENAAKPGLLRYQRPLMEGEAISYDFLYQGESSIVHPAVGRLAFLLESTGVRVRWITSGASEWTGLETDNAALEPLNRRGPRPLPIHDGEWNSVRVELTDAKVQIQLNNELVYERPIDPGSLRQFGLYRANRMAEIRVRNATMTGDWPETIPEDFMVDPVAITATTLAAR